MDEPIARIERIYKEEQTEGSIYVFNERNGIDFSCWTLELPYRDNQRNISCIKEGVYPCIKHHSPRFGNTIWIQEVENRSEILIHPSNYVGSLNPKTNMPDLLGCIAPGLRFGDITGDGVPEILDSKKALKELLRHLPGKFYIEITEK